MLFLPCIRSSTNCSCVGQTRIPQAAGGPKRVLSLMEAGWSFAAAQSPPKRGGGRFYPGLQLERVQGETHDLWARRNKAVPCACTTRHLGSKTEQGLFKTWRGEGSTVRQQTPQAEVCSSPVQSRVLRCYCYQWYNSLKCHRFAFRCQAETAELTVREVTFSFQGTGSKILLSFVFLLREKNSSTEAPLSVVKREASSMPPVKSPRLWQCCCHCQALLACQITPFTSLGTSYFCGRWTSWGQTGRAASHPRTSFFHFAVVLFQILLKEFW